MKKSILMALAIVTATMSMGQEKLNPWGLVYDGALMENVVGEVQIHPVSYEVGGLRVSANVYTPKGYTKDGRYAAVVVSHPNGGVKEQVSGMFAQKLAEAGYVAIACDARYQGQSAGQPRGNDIPTNRIEDIRGMIDFISQYPGVDKERIGAFGVCGGGGYTVAAAQSDRRIKAVAALSMFNTGRVRRNGYADSQLATVQERLAKAAEARQQWVETGQVVYPPKQAIPTEEQLKAMPFDLYREGIFYYGTSKYRHENDGASAPVQCMLDLMMWDATDRMTLIDQPLLLMTGEISDSKYMTEEAMEKATGTSRKEMYVVPGASHIKTYYVPEYVEQERQKLVEFFKKYL